MNLNSILSKCPIIYPITGTANALHRQSRHHLSAQRTYGRSRSCQSDRVAVEQEQNHHREYPVAAHAVVEVDF